ncbi:LysR family transcriptional regulator [Mesorhizobium sp. INR15]|uniref:LysR family transcriptional regulator n=1 Tax=Mesorhizobium sp. INR15 TaxID=2654248 RepID=UPI001896439C|nr:LysR family transcriptional regulator [Mesorhizobium sp. INR15]QPC91863.1 LysR family transcriptional regulator [Mesorhizobium sp. INR15]
MHWDDLRIFLAVARDGSISSAAKRMNVQHSTVSRRIRLLETQLGTRLIERKKSGYELTPAGDELRMAAGKMELEVLEVEGALGGQEDRVAGELRVSAINNMASSVMMPIFASFSEAYPDIQLHVQVSNRYVSLAERHADIAIRLTNTPLDTLVGTKLTNVASAVYGERGYVEALRASEAKPKWLGVECCAFHQAWTGTACPDHQHNFFVDDTLLTLAALKQGLGLAYLPCFMGDSAEQLERFREPDPAHDLGLWLLYHPDLRRTKRVRVFREHMMARIRDQSALFEGRRPQPQEASPVAVELSPLPRF